MADLSWTEPDGTKVEVIQRDTLTVENVMEHLIYERAYEIVFGQNRANIKGIDRLFVEELRWPRM